MNHAEHYYSVTDIVSKMGWTRDFIYHLIDSGKLRPIMKYEKKSFAGYAYRIPHSTLQAYIDSNIMK